MIDNYEYITNLGIKCKDRPGDQKAVCPKCAHTRKKSNDPSLYINVYKGVWKCYNPGCEWENGGGVPNQQRNMKEYTRPESTASDLSQKVKDYFETYRLISAKTVEAFRVTAGETYMPQVQKNTMAIHFNYYRNGELINIKYKDSQKHFKMVGGAELIFYGMDTVKDFKYVIIGEGEEEAMCWYEAGYQGVSVPNGATASGNAKLEYIDNCYDWIDKFERIYIATDNDAPGQALAVELSRRLGRDRCYMVKFPDDCKDANDVLIKHDVFRLATCFNDAQPYPIESVISVNDVYDGLLNELENGLTPGVKISCMHDLSELHSWRPGQLINVTGAPNHGKSAFVDNVILELAKEHGWRIGIWSSEKPKVERHLAELYQIYLDKSFYVSSFDTNRINKKDIDDNKQFFDEHFKFVDTKSADLTIDGLLNKGKELVRRYGIRCLVLDNWSTIEHGPTGKQSRHDYAGVALSKMSIFCKTNGCDIILVAHPNKGINNGGKVRVANGYDVSDSSHFYNLVDSGFTVYRNFETGLTDVIKWKNRWRELGELGQCHFKYKVATGRFLQSDPVNTGQSQTKFIGQTITNEEAKKFAGYK